MQPVPSSPTVDRLTAENRDLRQREQALLAYVRAKIDQLLGVMGTRPLRPEELDDTSLVQVDPIGIISDAFAQIVAHLHETNAELSLARDEIRAIFDTAGAGILVVDRQMRLLAYNQKSREMFFAGREEVVGCDFREAICGSEIPVEECILYRILKTCHAEELADFVLGGRHFHVIGTPVKDRGGKLVQIVLVYTDITERKRAEDALRKSEGRYRSLYQTMHEGVALHEVVRNAAGEASDYRILDVNPAFEAILGLDRATVVNRLASAVYGETPPPGLAVYAQVAESGNPVSFEMNFGTEPRIFSISVASPTPGQFATIFEDITSRKQVEQKIQQLAFFDPLTGLPNRTLLIDRLGQVMAQAVRSGQMAAVLFLDIDRFKAVNDSFGHASGDQMLKVVAERLMACIRKSDTVARVGGDEFVVILTSVDTQQDVVVTAEKILATFSAPLLLEGHEVFGSGSLGIAIYPVDGQEVSTLLKNADMAMYRAKELGRNTFQFYTEEMNIQTMQRLLLCNDLRRALERGEFSLDYQPQIDLASGRITGLEALLRWRHPELGNIPPDQFIPLAEETGLINAIGHWVLATACRQVVALQRAGHVGLKIAVNLSAQQFKQAGLIPMIAETLAATGLAAGCLELELTESTIMTSAESNRQTLRNLKELGIQLAIDDFGTGYSSLGYLKHFPIDRLKIDRSFVHDIIGSADAAAIVEAIITLARTLHIKVIAEGVETRQQMDFLRERGCEEVQGYYFGIPGAAEELATLLEQAGQR